MPLDLRGGLNLAANLLGKPGKMDVQGDMVQDMFDAGRLGEINDYCRCDVLDTYFVFLRSRVVLGQLTLEQEHAIIAETKIWLEQRAPDQKAYSLYLEKWGDWENPWEGRGGVGPWDGKPLAGWSYEKEASVFADASLSCLRD